MSSHSPNEFEMMPPDSLFNNVEYEASFQRSEMAASLPTCGDGEQVALLRFDNQDPFLGFGAPSPEALPSSHFLHHIPRALQPETVVATHAIFTYESESPKELENVDQRGEPSVNLVEKVHNYRRIGNDGEHEDSERVVQSVTNCARTWECARCKKQFKQVAAAHAHVRKEHFGEKKSYECVSHTQPTSLAVARNLLVKQMLKGIKIIN
ncbi:hypothetical protein K439DRAFT_1617462 [Ramaria rubella]|nr:hypothetical protein K439DRAFT_1617462 [Ramaria rubella]